MYVVDLLFRPNTIITHFCRDFPQLVGHLNCKICGVTFRTPINCKKCLFVKDQSKPCIALSEHIDVYSDWIDACEKSNKEKTDAPVLGGKGDREIDSLFEEDDEDDY
jgi:transcription elongation factor Elf1